MRRAVPYLIVAVLLTLGLGACRSHRHLHQEEGPTAAGTESQLTAPPTATERLDTIQNILVGHYSANFSCTVNGVKVNGQIRMTQDSLIWVSLYRVIELGRVVLTPTRVQGYVKVMNQHFDGDYAEIRRRWGVDMDYGTIEALLLGNCPPDCTKSKEPKREKERVSLWYNQTGGAQRSPRQVTLAKDYRSKRLTSTELYTPSVSQRLQCSYSETTRVGGQPVPTLIAVSIASRKLTTTTEVKLERIALNQPQSYPFSIPKRSTRI